MFGQSHIYFVCLYMTKTCRFANQKRLLCHLWGGIWFVKHTMCLSFCQEWVWVKGGWSDLWGVGSDCYAELIQSSEHLCSPLIFKSMQHCKRITIPESQYPLMRHFYSCHGRLKKSVRTFFVRTGNSENVFQLWIMLGEAVHCLRWGKPFSVALCKTILIDDPEDKMTDCLSYKGK